MEELDEELWKLGIYAKTEHNEVAPSQHELAPVFTTSNIATDHNQLTMEIMKKVAANHGLVCLLHEKPFAGVNGSGKHVNWSLSTDTGENLFSPGKNPAGNLRFLLFLCAVIKAVDEYQDLLRISVASPGNDHRLGGSEAPPAIISMFIGEDLENILTAIEKGEVYTEMQDRTMNIGISLPRFKRDTTDRNRTSPFAFTGNKFEFRMPGSGASISCPSYMLNVTVAEALRQFSDILESSKDMEASVKVLIKDTMAKHKRIIFNGNNYSEEWIAMADSKGLLNLNSSVDALSHFTKDKNLELFKTHCIFTEVEVRARQEIILREYCNILNIEALTMTDMVNKDILPAVSGYIKALTDTANGKKALSAGLSCDLEKELISNLSSISLSLHRSVQELDNALIEVNAIEDLFSTAEYYNKKILSIMKEIRIAADTLETMTASSSWPFPAYGELLFSV
jgi:glutamine synthetase